MLRELWLTAALAGAALAGQAGQAADPLAQAYEAAREKQYERAIALFQQALERDPDRISVRKDLGYTLLKAGETEAARDQFAIAVRLDPQDWQAALELAFLCHETGRTAEARRIFDEARRSAPAELRPTAEAAFENIDRPLREGIGRWTQALAANPGDFTAHRELAELAEKRGEHSLAAEHYLQAWRLRPDQKSLLVDYGRACYADGRLEEGRAALIAAMWGGEPRAAEAARKLFGPRYPYVYEFRLALELDPTNVALRQELGHLLKAMGRDQEARQEAAGFVAHAGPDNLPPPSEPRAHQIRELAFKSYRAGYLNDALKYSLAAHEQDPLDFEVMLQLGWTYNMLRQDGEALRWFRLARKSPDPAIARQAARAYWALRPDQARLRISAWMFPTYSSRWQDVFAYAQWKAEWRLGALPARVYFSTRAVGNGRERAVWQPSASLGIAAPQLSARVESPPNRLRGPYLSESSLIPALGFATNYWHGAMLWAEAGIAVKYRGANWNDSVHPNRRHQPDFRGGVAFVRGFGHRMGAAKSGPYFETNADAVFLTQYGDDLIFYSQNRAGYTLRPWPALGGLQTQWFLATNLIADSRRQHWANAVESGPGVRFRWSGMPRDWLFSVHWVRGRYNLMTDNPGERMYNDLRVGFWWSLLR